MSLVFILCGFVVGTISGVLGIGGGAMLVPLFIFFFKFNIYQAVGTSLAVIVPMALMGGISHHIKGNVQLAPVLLIAVGAMAGMFLAGQIIHYIPAPVLRKGFAIFLIIIAIKMLLK